MHCFWLDWPTNTGVGTTMHSTEEACKFDAHPSGQLRLEAFGKPSASGLGRPHQSGKVALMSLASEQSLESAYVMGTFARKPVELVRGSGMAVFDDEGREYLDFIGGIGAVSLGHCHPAVTAALSLQAEKPCM